MRHTKKREEWFDQDEDAEDADGEVAEEREREMLIMKRW